MDEEEEGLTGLTWHPPQPRALSVFPDPGVCGYTCRRTCSFLSPAVPLVKSVVSCAPVVFSLPVAAGDSVAAQVFVEIMSLRV